jgi:hypothetical protein
VIDNKVVENGVINPAVVLGGFCDDQNTESIIVEYREFGGDGNWTAFTTASTAVRRFEITGLKPKTAYEASVTYRSVRGVISSRLVLGPITTADLQVPIENVFDKVSNAALSQLFDAYREDMNTITEAANSVSTIIDDVNLLAETSLEQTLRDARHREEYLLSTHLQGVPISNAVTWVRNDLTETRDGQNAVVNTIAVIGALNSNGSSFLINEDTVMVSPTQSLGQKFFAIDTSFDQANALIIETAAAFADANAATANSILELKADFEGNVGALWSESNAHADALGVTASKLDLLGGETANGTAWALDETKVRIGSDTLANRLISLKAATDGANATILNVQTAQAANNAAFASQISSVSATASGASSTASLALTASNDQGARVTVRTDVNGYVVGTQLINGGPGASNFIVNVDNYVIGHPSGTTKPLVFSGGVLRADGIVATNIAANIITANHIVGGAVTTVSWNEQYNGFGISGSPAQCFSMGHPTTFAYAAHEIKINVTCGHTGGGDAGIIARVLRNGTILGERSFRLNQSFQYTGAFTFFDQPPSAGTNTYSITVHTSAGSDNLATHIFSNMNVTELKR